MHPTAALGQLQPIPYQPGAPQPGADQMLLSEPKGAGRVFRALPDQGVRGKAWAKLESLGQSSGPGRPEQAERRTRLGAGLQLGGGRSRRRHRAESRDLGASIGPERAAETESQGPPLSCLGEASPFLPGRGLHRHPHVLRRCRPAPAQLRPQGPRRPLTQALVHACLP